VKEYCSEAASRSILLPRCSKVTFRLDLFAGRFGFSHLKMRSWLLLIVPFISAIRIIQSNDDGWAEINVRTLFDSLSASGHEVVLSAPAENQSGTGMSLTAIRGFM